MIGFGLNIGNRGVFGAGGGGGYDADAQAFFDRVTAAGGTLTTTEKNATNQLVLDMKSAGTWTSMKAIYPMVGASAAACAQNLKSSSFTGTFTSGWTFASTGVTPNGTSAYMDTNYNVNTQGLLDSAHISYYSRTNIASNQGEMGCFDGSNGIFMIYGQTGFTYKGINSTSTNVGSVFSPTTGLLICNRASSTTEKYFFKGNLVDTLSKTSTSKANLTIWLGAHNFTSSPNWSTKQCAFSSIGDGLTDTQASNFYTAVQTFNQTLNRQVGAQIVSDADAQAYIDRVYTAGGTLTNTEANAVNQLTIDLKAAGIWTAMKAVYPMVGSSAAACAQNLKSSSFTGTFTSGWTFASTGVTPNGTSAYMDTALNQSTVLSNDSCHLSFYSRTNAIVVNAFEIGGYVSPYGALLACSYTGLGSLSHLYSYPTDTAQSNSFENSQAFYIANRSSQTSNKIIRNSIILATNTTSRTSVLANSNIYIAASSPTTQFSSRQCAFASIGDGLTDTQASNFYTAVQAFQTTLSRAIAP